MKKILALLVLLLVLILVVVLMLWKDSGKKNEQIYVSHEMLTKQIEQLGNLEVVKYSIQDMMEYQKTRKWLPNSKAQIKVVGEVIACLDLTKIGPDDIYTEGDSVSLILPIPEICHYKLDHSRSKVYNVEYGLWETAELVDEAYKQAEQHLYTESLKMGIAQQSRTNAIQVLTPLLKGLGFARISIGFKSAPNSASENTNNFIFRRENN